MILKPYGLGAYEERARPLCSALFVDLSLRIATKTMVADVFKQCKHTRMQVRAGGKLQTLSCVGHDERVSGRINALLLHPFHTLYTRIRQPLTLCRARTVIR